MENIKFFAKDDNVLKLIFNNVKCFTENIGLYFGLDKCAKIIIKKGRIKETLNRFRSCLKVSELEDEKKPKIPRRQ